MLKISLLFKKTKNLAGVHKIIYSWNAKFLGFISITQAIIYPQFSICMTTFSALLLEKIH